MCSLILWHRIFTQSYKITYCLVFKQGFGKKLNLTLSSMVSWTGLPLLGLLVAWMKLHVILFSSSAIVSTFTKSFGSTTQHTMCGGTDIIKPETSCCNVMLLADYIASSNLTKLHHFLYGHVLGAYHANVIYTGPGMQDYEAHCFDFLWVRWYEVVDPGSSGWSNSTLDSVRFPPLHEMTLLAL